MDEIYKKTKMPKLGDDDKSFTTVYVDHEKHYIVLIQDACESFCILTIIVLFLEPKDPDSVAF